ncbi:MAG: sialate O-acetylesterase [Imperialibacter sp.]|uniref:sialate O-acetylesterase n=1 Tax=Imperialibacter sp. TaxID=2038411 RepID=UPI0032ED3917
MNVTHLKLLLFVCVITILPACQSHKPQTWVFIMAGQSNMAGRGIVEPQDTVTNPRILTIDSLGKVIKAKEPLHFYEPSRVGLDCGLSFAKTLLPKVPDNVTIMIIPTAVGGSSMSQWLSDSLYRNVKLLSNFKEKVAIGKQHGEIKAILWHQGESDANQRSIEAYPDKIPQLLSTFRSIVQNDSLPIFMGELGSYSNNNDYWQMVNRAIHEYAATDQNVSVIGTQDLIHKGDTIHFNSEGQREIGKRFAASYLNLTKSASGG